MLANISAPSLLRLLLALALISSPSVRPLRADDDVGDEKKPEKPEKPEKPDDESAPRETTAGKIVAEPKDAVPLGVGATAPDVELLNAAGEKVALREVLAEKPTVLIFYRGGWCPFCMRHLADVAKVKDELVEAGLQVIAVSPEMPSFVAKSKEERKLDYTLLSDPKAAAIRGFGLAFRLDDATYRRYQRFVDIEVRAGGETHRALPVPAAFVLSRAAEILFVHSEPDYKKRIDAEKLREAALKALRDDS